MAAALSVAVFGKHRFRSLILLSCFYVGCHDKRNETIVQNDPIRSHPITIGGLENNPGLSRMIRKPTGQVSTVFTTANGFESIIANLNVDIERKKEGLVIHALSTDPVLVLPSLNVPPGSRLIVHIQIVAP